MPPKERYVHVLTPVQQIKAEYEILHLIFHRNKNQHRNASWWKHFSILHRQLRKVVLLESLFHQAAVYAEFLVKKIVPGAYRHFNGILKLGQFLTLGMALLGALSKVFVLLRDVYGAAFTIKAPVASALPLTTATDEELGEVVVMDWSPDRPEGEAIAVTDPVPAKPMVTGKDGKGLKRRGIDDIFGSKKKTKRTKSSIDDIFGAKRKSHASKGD